MPVDDDALTLDQRARNRLVLQLAAAQLFLDPLDQDLHAVRLGDVVVSAGREADKLVRLFGLGRHHDDRDVTGALALLQLAADIKPALLRQHQVQHNQVRQLQLGLPQPLRTVERRDHLESFPLEVATQDFDQGSLVLDHQNLLLRHGWFTRMV